MKKDWSKLSNTEKHRLAAAFFHMNPDHRKSIMGRGVRTYCPSTSSSYSSLRSLNL